MKYRKNIAYALWLAGLGGFFAACNDDWDNHYGSNGSVPETGLMELIRSDGDLSAFCLILEKTGADTLLSASQTYTVWASTHGVQPYRPIFQPYFHRDGGGYLYAERKGHVV